MCVFNLEYYLLPTCIGVVIKLLDVKRTIILFRIIVYYKGGFLILFLSRYISSAHLFANN